MSLNKINSYINLILIIIKLHDIVLNNNVKGSGVNFLNFPQFYEI